MLKEVNLVSECVMAAFAFDSQLRLFLPGIWFSKVYWILDTYTFMSSFVVRSWKKQATVSAHSRLRVFVWSGHFIAMFTLSFMAVIKLINTQIIIKLLTWRLKSYLLTKKVTFLGFEPGIRLCPQNGAIFKWTKLCTKWCYSQISHFSSKWAHILYWPKKGFVRVAIDLNWREAIISPSPAIWWYIGEN